MTQEIDYRSVEVPDGGDYENWGYTERRAYILTRIEDVGHPKRLRQKDLAEQFDVSESTITRDIDAIGDHVGETIGDRRTITTASVVDKCICKLMDEGEWRDAAELQLKLDEWVTRETTLSEMQEQLNELLSEDSERSDSESASGSGTETAVSLQFEDS